MWPRGFTQVGSLQYKQSTSAEFRGERFALECAAPRPNQRLQTYRFTAFTAAAYTLADLKPSTAADAIPSV